MRTITNYHSKKLYVLFTIFLLSLISFCTEKYTYKGQLFYSEDKKVCTMAHCDCCNDCSTPVLFATNTDTFQLCGTRYDTSYNCGYLKSKDTVTCDTTIDTSYSAPLSCSGNECEELNCYPFRNGKIYEITGSKLKSHRNSEYKYFLVITFSEVKAD
jgi:hypothetical protein